MSCLLIIEPPMSPIGKNAPGQAAMQHIKENLVRGVLVSERVTAFATTDKRAIQRKIPGLCIANSKSTMQEYFISEQLIFVCKPRSLFAIKEIVWPFRTFSGLEGCLHLKYMFQ